MDVRKLNGGYGALANSYFLYFRIENAEAITLSGQLENKYVSSKMNEYLNKLFGTENEQYWVYSDTDSAYYTLKPFVDKLKKKDDWNYMADMVNKFALEFMAPKIKEISAELCEYMNGFEHKMVWEREVISPKAFWVGKKKYAMIVVDNEGVRYKEPELKVQGMEAVKSSTPEWARDYLKECYKTILMKDEATLHSLVKKIEEEFQTRTIDEIAMPKCVKGISDYTHEDENILVRPKCPPYTRGCIVHNKYVRDKGLTHIKEIVDGAKVKYVKMKMPNPTHQEWFAYEEFMYEEYGLEKYVDRDFLYKSSFLDPLNNVLKTLGWNSEETITLF